MTEIDAARVDAVWCLGDTVGYGPRPNECCDLVKDRADYCLLGNHDLVVLGELSVSEFNDEAAAAAIWTADVLTAASRAFLASLKPFGAVDGVDLFHASARDPVWEYVLTEEAAIATLELLLLRSSWSGTATSLSRSRPTTATSPAGLRRAARRSPSTGEDCSIPVPWDSPVTGIPEQPGCCSISRRGLLSSAGSHIRLSARRPRCASGVFPSRSRLGSSEASNRGKGHRWQS